MSPVLQSVQFFLLAGITFLLVGALVSAVLTAVASPHIASVEPAARYRGLALLACLPLLTAVTLLLSATVPSLLALVVPALDHCLTHDDDHAHLCFVHLPNLKTHVLPAIGLTFGISYVLLRAALSTASMVRALRVTRALTRTGIARPDLGATLLETPAPICLTAGLFQPSILLSRGLFELLSDDERTIVLAHEREHVRCRHALVASLLRACSAFHFPAVKRWIVRELEVAAEQVCDEAAGRTAGDRTAVAAAILSVERVTQHADMNRLGIFAVGVGTCALERRVRALLTEPVARASFRPLYVSLGFAATVALMFAEHLHHATEAYLSLLVH